jgi:hypothetical protein
MIIIYSIKRYTYYYKKILIILHTKFKTLPKITTMSIGMNKASELENEKDNEPIPVPKSKEEEEMFKTSALGLIEGINTKDTYKFVFISGERVGNFISNNKDMMFISVEGSGKVSIPLSWLREIIAV